MTTLIGEGECNQPRLRYGAETNKPTYKCPAVAGLHIGCCMVCGAAVLPHWKEIEVVWVCCNENCGTLLERTA